jgi:hypothetical protein
MVHHEDDQKQKNSIQATIDDINYYLNNQGWADVIESKFNPYDVTVAAQHYPQKNIKSLINTLFVAQIEHRLFLQKNYDKSKELAKKLNDYHLERGLNRIVNRGQKWWD